MGGCRPTLQALMPLLHRKEERGFLEEARRGYQGWMELMEERGLLTRVFMAIQLCPPLVIGKAEIDRMVSIVDESLTLAEREFGFA